MEEYASSENNGACPYRFENWQTGEWNTTKQHTILSHFIGYVYTFTYVYRDTYIHMYRDFWELVHQNVNNGYLWGWRFLLFCFYSFLYCITFNEQVSFLQNISHWWKNLTTLLVTFRDILLGGGVVSVPKLCTECICICLSIILVFSLVGSLSLWECIWTQTSEMVFPRSLSKGVCLTHAT